MKNLISGLKDGDKKESYEMITAITEKQFWDIIGSDKFDKKIKKFAKSTINDWWASPMVLGIATAVMAAMLSVSGFFFFSVLKLNEITVKTEVNIEKLAETVGHLELEVQEKLLSVDREVIRLRDRLEK